MNAVWGYDVAWLGWNRATPTVAKAAVLGGFMPATAPITGTLTAYAATVAVPEAWTFPLQGRFREVSGDFEYWGPAFAPGQFYLLVSSNTPVRLSIDFGQARVGGTSCSAVLRCGLPQENAGRLLEETCLVAEQQGCDVYESKGPVTHARIDLLDFWVLTGRPLTAGGLRGFLQLHHQSGLRAQRPAGNGPVADATLAFDSFLTSLG